MQSTSTVSSFYVALSCRALVSLSRSLLMNNFYDHMKVDCVPICLGCVIFSWKLNFAVDS